MLSNRNRRADLEIATVEHAAALATRLCAEDQLELDALGVHPRVALEQSVVLSDLALTIHIEGEVAALLGTVRKGWGGQFWLLTGTAVRKFPVAFIRYGHMAFDLLSGRHKAMGNMVDARHEQALRLARHFGFQVLTPVPYGVHGEPFCPIRWSREERANVRS